ncbi:MAG: serine/threonine-protein kinase [bacterium]
MQQPDRIGDYTIISQLGKGSMGIVYEGQPGDGSESVAIKVFYPDPALSREETRNLLDRFEREGQSLSRIRQENVVKVLEAGTDGEREFIVMEKLEGYNLKELLELGTRFTLSETLEIILQLLAGLSACHRGGIVHRDIKPANLIRSSTGQVKLTDFGIARVVTDQTLTREGTIVGTPNYMSPEQIRGEEVDARSDIFSAGAMMYELLTGRKPFEGPDMTAIMYNVTNVHPPTPKFYNGALPDDIEEIIFKALAKNPDDRYESAEGFAGVLRKLEQDLHYRDDTEAVLNALPSAPVVDALSRSPGGLAAGAAAGTALGAGSRLAGSTPPPSSALGSVSLSGAGGIIPGTIYCIDCGFSNREDDEFCTRCMRPLLKRSMMFQMSKAQARRMRDFSRGDKFFMACLSVLMAGCAILIIWLFFRHMI